MTGITKKGLLLIPDIGGYTEFINVVEIDHGAHIIADLLESVIKNTTMGLSLSEVEGDACFFYNLGPPPAFDVLMEQITKWFKAFHHQQNLIKGDNYCQCGACNYTGNMTLKVVAHHGEFGIHRIGGFTKLIGREVVLIHRLLKNSVGITDYFLLSKALYEASGASADGEFESFHVEEVYPVFGSVPLVCFDLSSIRQSLSGLPRQENIPALAREITEEVEIKCSLRDVSRLLMDQEKQMLWVDDIRSIEMDRTVPLRAGAHHVCVIGNQKLDVTLERIIDDNDEFQLTARIRPPKLMVKKLSRIFLARREGDHVKVEFTMAFSGQPVMGWIFEYMMRSRWRRNLKRSLDNLKNLLESGNHTAA